MTASPIPGLAPARPRALPAVARRDLPNGVTVLAVRRGTVPMAEVRLRVEFGQADPACTALLTKTLLSGTARRSAAGLDAELHRVGGRLAAAADADRVVVAGGALSGGLERLLDVLGDVLTGAAYPEDEVAVQRRQLTGQAAAAGNRPQYAALTALNRIVYRAHPYADQSPEPERIAAVTAEDLRALHAERIRPAGATLVIVGAVDPERALDAAEAALGPWAGARTAAVAPPMPPLPPVPNPIAVVDRPGAAQSCLRLALPALGRADPGYPAMQLANTVFGGYFSSRLVENLREDKGYAYTPQSLIVHMRGGSRTAVFVDVPAETTGPALAEIRRELDRLTGTPVGGPELEQARRYAMGSLSLGIAANAELADTLAALCGDGLGLDWIAGHAERLGATTGEEVSAAAARHFRRSDAVTLVLGDAAAVESQVRAFGDVVRMDN